MFQSFQLLPALSALENVMLPLELQAISGARGLAEEALGKVGLAQRMTHRQSICPAASNSGSRSHVLL